MLNSSSKKLAAALAFLLKRRGMKTRLALACKVRPQAVSNWARDGRVDKKHLEIIAEFGGVTVSALTNPDKYFEFNGESVVGIKPAGKTTRQSVQVRPSTQKKIDIQPFDAAFSNAMESLKNAYFGGDQEVKTTILIGIPLTIELAQNANTSRDDDQQNTPLGTKNNITRLRPGKKPRSK